MQLYSHICFSLGFLGDRYESTSDISREHFSVTIKGIKIVVNYVEPN